jgi:hypothetical protein
VSTSRGVLRAQAWPKPRGAAKTTDEKNRQLIFSAYQGLIKRLTPYETESERNAIATHNRTHRGQRGSAAIRLRDWQTQRLYGRGVLITNDSGPCFFPAALRRDASHILDHVAAEAGQMMQRDIVEWTALPAGSVGHALTSQGPGLPNVWQARP